MYFLPCLLTFLSTQSPYKKITVTDRKKNILAYCKTWAYFNSVFLEPSLPCVHLRTHIALSLWQKLKFSHEISLSYREKQKKRLLALWHNAGQQLMKKSSENKNWTLKESIQKRSILANRKPKILKNPYSMNSCDKSRLSFKISLSRATWKWK